MKYFKRLIPLLNEILSLLWQFRILIFGRPITGVASLIFTTGVSIILVNEFIPNIFQEVLCRGLESIDFTRGLPSCLNLANISADASNQANGVSGNLSTQIFGFIITLIGIIIYLYHYDKVFLERRKLDKVIKTASHNDYNHAPHEKAFIRSLGHLGVDYNNHIGTKMGAQERKNWLIKWRDQVDAYINNKYLK